MCYLHTCTCRCWVFHIYLSLKHQFQMFAIFYGKNIQVLFSSFFGRDIPNSALLSPFPELWTPLQDSVLVAVLFLSPTSQPLSPPPTLDFHKIAFVFHTMLQMLPLGPPCSFELHAPWEQPRDGTLPWGWVVLHSMCTRISTSSCTGGLCLSMCVVSAAECGSGGSGSFHLLSQPVPQLWSQTEYLGK